MGCGSSSLKGEKHDNVGQEETPQPIKKVQTNFSTIDYDSAAKGRRDTVYAPDDTIRQKSEAPPPIPEHISELPSQAEVAPTALGTTQLQPTGGDRASFDNKLPNSNPQNPLASHEVIEKKEPYRDIHDNLNSPTNYVTHHEHIPQSQAPAITSTNNQGLTYSNDIPTQINTPPDSTSHTMGLFSKHKKLSEEQPITHGEPYTTTTLPNQDSYLNAYPTEMDPPTNSSKFGFEPSTSSDKDHLFQTRTSTSSQYSTPSLSNDKDKDASRKKSLYGRFQDKKRGPGISGLSDEELQKYTGKTRAELDEYARTTPGVAGGQRAGALTAGGTSGIGMSAGAGEGLGGWGMGAGKDPVVR